MTRNLSMETTLVKATCITCGVVYALPDELYAYRRRLHQDYCCPNGHWQHSVEETEEEKLRKLLHEERVAKMTVEEERNRVRIELRNLRTRVENGVCPRCHRSFKNLRQHIETKHKSGQQFPESQ